MRGIPLAPMSAGDNVKIGARLRASRTARGLTLEQVALVTGLTRGFLSRVERDETSPSVASLVTLCQAMSIEIGALFTAADANLVQAEDAPAINLGGIDVSESLLTPRRESRVQLVRSRVEPGGSGDPDLYTLNCDVEVLHVVRGAVEIRFSDEMRRVHAGDTLTFSGREPHSWRNVSDTDPAELLWVLIPAPWSASR